MQSFYVYLQTDKGESQEIFRIKDTNDTVKFETEDKINKQR